MERWTQPSEEAILTLGRQLIEAWKTPSPHGLEVSQRRILNQAHLPVVHGLAAHAHTLGAIVLDLYEQGKMFAAMPLVRTVYESAIQAQWLAQSKEAIAAFANEDLRHRQRLSAELHSAASQAFQSGASNLAHLDMDALETSADPQARDFRDLCHDLTPGGHDAYIIYRAMSMEAHPSVLVVDQYVHPTKKEPGITLLLEPKRSNSEAWLVLVVASFVWAARAVDFFDQDHLRRSALREAARQLGVTEHFDLTPQAHQREERERLRRRKAEWKGPARKQQMERRGEAEIEPPNAAPA